MRKVALSHGVTLILADTVGFISNLPHGLVEAFRATLEETVHSDLLLHVIDAADPRWQENEGVVTQVLEDIGAGEIPVVRVFNKIDVCVDEKTLCLPDDEEAPPTVLVSAKKSTGIDALHAVIITELQGAAQEETLVLGPHQGKLRAALYNLDAVLQETLDEQGRWNVTVRLTPEQKQRLLG
jgi:GTP-binding protein HflX